jgi:hypothetical protein
MHIFNCGRANQGQIQFNLVVQGYFAQLIAQFWKSVTNRSGSLSPEPHANEASKVGRSRRDMPGLQRHRLPAGYYPALARQKDLPPALYEVRR